jgi:hypothetical protein
MSKDDDHNGAEGMEGVSVAGKKRNVRGRSHSGRRQLSERRYGRCRQVDRQ